MSYLLGIDLGTTRTAAAVGRPDARQGETEIVNLGDRSSAVPSVLYVGDDGSVLVGEAAERRAVTSPEHVAREFKRRIGDPTPVLVAGRPWPPEELSARLVRWVVDQVAQREAGPAGRIAVTHPASWGPHKKDRLGAALSAQGLPVTFLAEPQAAALHYAAAERVEPGSTIAVYDFGGGTFDAAVVHKDGHKNGPGFSLLGKPEGVDRLGGIDFDEIVFEHVRNGMPEAFDGLDEGDPAVLSAVAAIRRECSEAKEALSSDTEVSISVLTPAAQGSVRLHRSEFEAAIQPQVEETVDALRRAISSAGLTPAQLSAVLLVGGSSRIPLIGQLVSEQLSRPVTVDVDPKNAIPMGAALSLFPTSAGTGALPPPGGPQRSGGPAQPPPARPAHGAPPPFAGPGAAPPPGPRGGPAGTGAYGPGPRAGGGSLPPRQGHQPPPPPPPPRPAAAAPAPDFDDEPRFERVPQRAGRTPGWLVSVGGVAAASAVVAAVVLWPNPDVDPTGSITPPTRTTTEQAGEPVPEPLPEPAPTEDEPEPTRQVRPTRPQPIFEPTPPPATTTPPPATTQPTTQPPPTSEPPPTPGPGGGAGGGTDGGDTGGGDTGGTDGGTDTGGGSDTGGAGAGDGGTDTGGGSDTGSGSDTGGAGAGDGAGGGGQGGAGGAEPDTGSEAAPQ